MKAKEHYENWKKEINDENVDLNIAAISACLSNMFHEAANTAKQRKSKNIDGLRNEMRDKWRAFCSLLPPRFRIPEIQNLAKDEFARIYQEAQQGD